MAGRATRRLTRPAARAPALSRLSARAPAFYSAGIGTVTLL
jgi:hypothetical protein